MRLSEGLIANKQNHQGHMIQTRRQEAVPGKMMYPRLFVRTTLVPRGSRRVKFKLNYGQKNQLWKGVGLVIRVWHYLRLMVRGLIGLRFNLRICSVQKGYSVEN